MPIRYYGGLLLVILIVIFPLFGHLDHMPLRVWDEARLSVSAAEMYSDHNYIVTHYDGKPDMWNTKPPLMIWLQVLMLHLIGFNEIAVRLPSAIAGLLTCLLLYWFFGRKMKEPWMGIISSLVLVTVPGYIGGHAARTGDYDALLTLFTTAYCLLFFWYLETGSRKALYGFFAALTLAVLTKGIAGLLFGPALAAYALGRKQTFRMLRGKELYIGLVAFVVVAAGYYLWREHLNSGYLAAVQGNEAGGRYLKVQENNGGDGWFYWDRLIGKYFSPWYLAALFGTVTGLNARNGMWQRLTVYLILLSVVFFGIISAGSTKHDWYLVPVYPFLAILAALLLWTVCRAIQDLPASHSFQRRNLLPYVFLVCIAFIPYREIINAVQKPESDGTANYDMSEYLKNVLHGNHPLSHFSITTNVPEGNIRWYVQALNREQHDVRFINADSLLPGSEVLAYEDNMKDRIDSAYQYAVRDRYESVTLYHINGRRAAGNPRMDSLQVAR